MKHKKNIGTWRSQAWYSRGYLPHFDMLGLIQLVTFRLADSLAQEQLSALREELKSIPEDKQNTKRRKMIEAYLDAGTGCCALKHSQLAALLQETLIKFDGQKYRLIAWCIMPNHVHVLIEPQIPLSKIVQSWKSYTGRWAMKNNDELRLGVPGKNLWMREYWDRYIRDDKHFYDAIEYIHNNPVKAGLCEKPESWLWSSACQAGAWLSRSNPNHKK